MIDELKDLVSAIEDERYAIEKMAEYIQTNNKLMTDMWGKKVNEATVRLDRAIEVAKTIIKEFPANTNLMVN